MTDIYTTSPVSYVGRLGIFDQLMASLIRQNVTYKIAATPEEGMRIFDAVLPDGVLLQREYLQHSGTLNPAMLIRYLHTAIRINGGKVYYNRKVTGLNKSKNGWLISYRDSDAAEDFELEIDRVVSAAGPFTGQLLKEVAPYFDELINPQRVFLCFFEIDPKRYNELSNKNKEKLIHAFPVINSSKGGRMGSFFSMIESFTSDSIPIIKIGGHFQRSSISDLDEVWRKEVNAEEQEWSRSNLLDYFHMLRIPIGNEDLQFHDDYSCVYSLTESEVPLVTPIIGDDGNPDTTFVVLGGMSGVGAKGTLTYGKVAADLMIGNEPQTEEEIQLHDAFGYRRLSAYYQSREN